jgi:hypothetical protein
MKTRKSVTVASCIEIIQYVKNLHYLLLFGVVLTNVLVVSGCAGNSSTSLTPIAATCTNLAGKTIQASYRGSYFSGHSYSNPTGNEFNQITNTTWPVYLCGIRNMEQQELIDCVNAY